MKRICSLCGGECIKVNDDRENNYKCMYCGNYFSDEDFAPKSTQTTSSCGAPSQMGVGMVEESGGDAVYAKVISSIVKTHAQNSLVGGTGSGFLISSKGFILTNAHCVCDNDGELMPDITVTVNDRQYKAYPVAVGSPLGLGRDNAADLCLLFAEGDFRDCHINTFGNYDEVRNGQKEYIVGDPHGEGICITSGIVSDRLRHISSVKYPLLMTDAATNPGNSGGPHYNSRAEVIGVHVAGRKESEGMNYAVPSYIAENFIAEVVKHEKSRNIDFGELNRYRETSTQSLSVVFSGIKLVLDVIEYIASLFGRK